MKADQAKKVADQALEQLAEALAAGRIRRRTPAASTRRGFFMFEAAKNVAIQSWTTDAIPLSWIA